MDSLGNVPTRRARDAASKDARRRQILGIAEKLFASTPYAELTMARVAKEVKLAKGTVYLYFESKESLFLQLLSELAHDWSADLESRLESLPPDRADKVAEALAESLAERPQLRRLFALHHAVLGHDLRSELSSRMEPLARRLEGLLPDLGPAGGERLLRWVHAAAIGLNEPFPRDGAESEVVEDEAKTHARRAELRDAIAAWLRGWPKGEN